MNLKEKIQVLIEKAKVCNMTLKWIIAGMLTEDTYDFINVFKTDLFTSNFVFSGYEKTVTDEFTTTVSRSLYLSSSDYLETVVMPNVSEVQTRGFYNVPTMTYCELGQITSTQSTSFYGCTALKHFKNKPETTGSIYLQSSEDLTVESLEGIIDNYADMTGAETAPTLQIGLTNINKLSEEYIIKAQQKNIMLK